MIDELKISNFRGLTDLTLRKLTTINVITGDNGAGKSTVLEAGVLAVNGTIQKISEIQASRGLMHSEDEGNFQDVFSNYQGTGLSMFSTLQKGVETTTTLRVEPPSAALDFDSPSGIDRSMFGDVEIVSERRGEINAQSTDIDALMSRLERHMNLFGMDRERAAREIQRRRVMPFQRKGVNGFQPDRSEMMFFSPQRVGRNVEARLNDLRNEKKEGPVISMMRTIRPGIDRIEYQRNVLGSGFYVFEEDGAPLSVGSLGAGVASLLRMGIIIASNAGGLVAIDEVEAGLYHERLPSVAKALFAAAKAADTQLFLATHSQEMIDALIDAAVETEGEDLAIYRLYRQDEALRVHRVGEEIAHSASLTGVDLR